MKRNIVVTIIFARADVTQILQVLERLQIAAAAAPALELPDKYLPIGVTICRRLHHNTASTWTRFATKLVAPWKYSMAIAAADLVTQRALGPLTVEVVPAVAVRAHFRLPQNARSGAGKDTTARRTQLAHPARTRDVAV